MGLGVKEITCFKGELHTVLDVLRWTVTQFERAGLFYGHGTDNAWDEACLLLMKHLYVSAHQLKVCFDAHLTAIEKVGLLKDIQCRIDQRMPLPYITGQAWFCELPFVVDRRVLIPRSGFSELIDARFEPFFHPPEQAASRWAILEIGTGSGCIAIAMAYAFETASIDAVDISADALAVAQHNVMDFGLEDRVVLIQSDLFSALVGKTYHLIVSNPPYVSEQEMLDLPPEYHYEPRLALEAGDEGLDIVLRLLREAPQYLVPGGLLVVEVGEGQARLEARFPDIPFVWFALAYGGEGIFCLSREAILACWDQLGG
jgi:ribosomal protein L3 glutamine methyltransferase